jgi:major membrane immunogen (membrane-anchored lipoprotein)
MNMRKLLLAAALASTMLLTACGADTKTINGVTYGTYGVANEKDMRNPAIEYEVSGWAVFWSVVFCETIVVPVYIIGWDLYQPVGPMDPNKVKGSVSK